jgi:hypothetical protein
MNEFFRVPMRKEKSIIYHSGGNPERSAYKRNLGQPMFRLFFRTNKCEQGTGTCLRLILYTVQLGAYQSPHTHFLGFRFFLLFLLFLYFLFIFIFGLFFLFLQIRKFSKLTKVQNGILFKFERGSERTRMSPRGGG